uniref:Uncharacterized protein n=1 Tax=Romanomermis culicivorax TaxID=13658 RepID=A0A915ILC4_ROMCU
MQQLNRIYSMCNGFRWSQRDNLNPKLTRISCILKEVNLTQGQTSQKFFFVIVHIARYFTAVILLLVLHRCK